MSNIRLNILIASLKAMELRSDVSPVEIEKYRSLIAREGIEHGSHNEPSNLCDCYYGMVS